MGITLNEFKAKVHDAARPNRFLLLFAAPNGGADSETLSYLTKGAQIPGRTVGDVELNWQGMKAKIAGDPTFDDFTVTMIGDYDFKARNTIDAWIKYIADQLSNERTHQGEYKVDAIVQQLGRKGEVLAEWKLIGFYPKTMDQIDLSMENNDQVEEFGVTFSYDYYEKTK